MMNDWKFWRKRKGGKWERWWIKEPINSYVWFQVGEWSRVTEKRPSALCRGTAVEEELLARNAQGDIEARNRLLEGNLRFITSIAMEYQHLPMRLDDIIAEGRMGMIRALEKFDPTRGVKLISYAVWWIRQAILKAAKEQGSLIRIPINRIADIQRLKNMKDDGFTDEDIEEFMSLEQRRYAEELDYAYDRLDSPVFANSDLLLHDRIPGEVEAPSDLAEIRSMRSALASGMARLKPRSAAILYQYYGLDGSDGCTLEELGEIHGITRERCRQVKEDALEKMQWYLRKERVSCFS